MLSLVCRGCLAWLPVFALGLACTPGEQGPQLWKKVCDPGDTAEGLPADLASQVYAHVGTCNERFALTAAQDEEAANAMARCMLAAKENKTPGDQLESVVKGCLGEEMSARLDEADKKRARTMNERMNAEFGALDRAEKGP